MRNSLKVLFICMLSIISIFSIGQGLMNSHHDFTGAAWSGGEACKPCHTPHNANMEVPGSPLWNHEVTGALFQVYSSSSLDATIGQPTGHSKLCLSCHDGTVAIDNHSGITTGTYYATFGNVTTDLMDDHPISFTYNTSLTSSDNELHDPSTTASGLGSTIQEDLLQDDVMQCTSCHDPHVSRNTEGCTGCHISSPTGMITKTLSLVVSNEGSALCLTCHKK